MHAIRIGAVAALAAGAVLAGGAAASAVPARTIGTFPTWSIGGASNAYTGTAAFASPGLTSPTVTSDSASITTASGASAYLGAGTGFGAEFGATRAQPYLTIRPRSASPVSALPVPAPGYSTTTIDFGAAGPAAGWGFAVGDIDADWVQVIGYDAGGAQVPVADLHEQGAANYCATSPKPPTCAGVTTFDVPNWTGTGTATETWPDGTITYQAATAYGNYADTTGAYDWFLPAATVHRIDLRYGAVNGSPVFQLWLAQPAPQTVISGTVSIPGATTVPSGTSVQLEAADGSTIADLAGDPVSSPVASDGSYSITTEQRAAYQLQVIPPAGYETPAAITVAATTATVTAPTIAMDPVPPPRPELAESGVDPGPLPLVAVALLLLGAAATVVAIAARRRARR
jgi:hypothetical protein